MEQDKLLDKRHFVNIKNPTAENSGGLKVIGALPIATTPAPGANVIMARYCGAKLDMSGINHPTAMAVYDLPGAHVKVQSTIRIDTLIRALVHERALPAALATCFVPLFFTFQQMQFVVIHGQPPLLFYYYITN